MFLYNETIKIDHSVHNEWVAWMKVKQIPDMMQSGGFMEYSLSRLLGTDETDGFTYTVQYLCSDFGVYQDFQQANAARMERQMQERYANKYVVFRSVMKVIERGE